MARQAAVISILFLVAGCSGVGDRASSPAPVPSSTAGVEILNGTVRFVVLGDVGMGNDKQREVASAVARICAERGCQFVIVNGDNIYPNGVTSPVDPQFEDKFEEPYEVLALPFYLVLGNHDNGNGAGSNPAVGDHQVAYAERTDRRSDKWHMPARYYTFTVGEVQFFGLDSGPQEVSQATVWPAGSRGDRMAAWLREEVPKSAAKWRFAFAHHPYVSNGPHGDAGLYDNLAGAGLPYKQMVEATLCNRAQIYFAGHDHDLQWLRPVSACGSTQFIVSGAGGAAIYTRGTPPHNEAFYENHEDHGFVWVDVTGDTFTGAFYDETGKQLFERSFAA